MSAIYLDTSGLLALLDRDAREHASVRQAVSALAEDDIPLVTTSYTLVETGALVRRRLGMRAFIALGEMLEDATEIVWVDEALHRAAWRHTAAEGRRGASLVDWVGFLLMRDRGIDTALALDKHFEQHGFRTLPAPV